MNDSLIHKIDLLVKSDKIGNQCITKISFENCSFKISNDFIIIEINDTDNDSIIGKIFPMKLVSSYKIYKK